MLAIGILLIVLAALIFLAMLFAGTGGGGVDLSIGFINLGQVSPFVIYLIGAASVLFFVMGLELTRSGTVKTVRRRRKVRQLEKENARLGQESGQTAPAGTATTGTQAGAPTTAGQGSTDATTTTDAPPRTGGGTTDGAHRTGSDDTGPLR